MKTKNNKYRYLLKSFYVGIAAVYASYISLFAGVIPVKAVVSDVPQTLSSGAIVLVKEADTQEIMDAHDPDGKFPVKMTFVISAYYSPLPNQYKYVTGSYASDIRLNGGGVHSADGTPVHPGMVAAPKGYAFGTKMNIPGIGTVAVHDRGGAIVHSGERGNSHDRLDVWMGYGDAGMTRALKWGKRTVEVTVYGIRPDMKEDAFLVGYSDSEKYEVANSLTFNSDLNFTSGSTQKTAGPANIVFGRTLELGAKGDDVSKVQKALKDLNYYSGEITGVVDDSTMHAIAKFQVSEKIVGDEQDYGAGYAGPKTLKILAVRMNTQAVRATGSSVGSSTQSISTPADAFLRNLNPGDKGDDVRKLQAELKKVNLLGTEPTGVYGKLTEHAVFKFQQINNLVVEKNSSGAGVFGIKTRQALNVIIASRQQIQQMIADRKKGDLS